MTALDLDITISAQKKTWYVVGVQKVSVDELF